MLDNPPPAAAVANSKNCISVGATQTTNELMQSGVATYTVFDATASAADSGMSQTFRVMQAAFGASVGKLGSGSFRLSVASPLDACSPLNNTADLAGSVVLVERGSCYFGDKAAAVQAAGGAAALIFDNQLGSYFPLGADSATAGGITIPVTSITRRLGQALATAVEAGRNMSISFAPAQPPAASFDNLSQYSSQVGPAGLPLVSSRRGYGWGCPCCGCPRLLLLTRPRSRLPAAAQGPTPDGRIKPDLVAPGTIISAKAITNGSSVQSCDTLLMAGTSMVGAQGEHSRRLGRRPAAQPCLAPPRRALHDRGLPARRGLTTNRPAPRPPGHARGGCQRRADAPVLPGGLVPQRQQDTRGRAHSQRRAAQGRAAGWRLLHHRLRGRHGAAHRPAALLPTGLWARTPG